MIRHLGTWCQRRPLAALHDPLITNYYSLLSTLHSFFTIRKTQFLHEGIRSFILKPMNIDAESIWIEVNLGAIRRNIQRLQQISGRPVMTVIKANAYGHGLVEVARTAAKAGAVRLCVARFEEALQLRQAGVETPLLVLGYTDPLHAVDAAKLNVSLCIFRQDVAAEYARVMERSADLLNLHLKVNTGMNRLGVSPEEALSFAYSLSHQENLKLEGVFTHFARADEPQAETTDQQIERFDRVITELESTGIRPPLVHAANSAASLCFPRARYDAIRPGIAIYGLNPDAKELRLPGEFEPALTWKSRLTTVRILPAGSGIGYNYRYYTSKEERIGAIAAGYADGLRRKLGNMTLVHGKRVFQTGGMCMDQSMYNLDEIPDAKPGDEVVLLGRQGNAEITADDIGASWNTTNYEVVCGLQARVPRYYFED